MLGESTHGQAGEAVVLLSAKVLVEPKGFLHFKHEKHHLICAAVRGGWAVEDEPAVRIFPKVR